MELDKKPEDIPDILRDKVEGELAKPGEEPYHDELALAMELADAQGEEMPAIALLGGSPVPTTVLLDWIDDLREGKEDEEEEKIAPSDKQSGMVPDFMPDSAIAIGIEVPDAGNDDDYFFSAARKQIVEEEEEALEDVAYGGGDDDKPKSPASAPSAPKTPPTKPAPAPPPKGGPK